MSNLDKSPSQSKETLKSKTTTSISKRLRELPLGRSIVMATLGGARASSSAANDSRFHRLWKNNWSKMFSSRQSAVSGENRKVQETWASRSGEKRRKSSSNSSSSPEGRTRKQGVAFSHDGDASKEEVGSGSKMVDLQLTSAKAGVTPSRKTLSNRLSGLMSQRKISHGAKYSAVKPDTSDSDSAYTDSACQPLAKPAEENSKKDCPMADRRLGGFAGLLSATGFRRTPAKTSESTIPSGPPVPLISLTVSSSPSSKQQELGLSSAISAGDVVVDTTDLATVSQSAIKSQSLSATIIIEDTNDDKSTSEITSTCRPQQQQQQQVQYGIYTTTTTSTNTISCTALTNAKSPATGSISSLPGTISTMRNHITSLPASSSVQAFSSSFGPASRGPSSYFPNASRSATTHSFPSSSFSSFYPGTTSGGGKVTSRPPITQSYSFSSPSSSPSFYSGGVGNPSTCSQSTPTIYHAVSGLTTPVTTSTSAKTTFTTTTATTTTGLISAPISGNKFSLLAGRRRGPQQAPGLRSCSLEEYRTSTSDSQPSSDMVTSNSSFWSPTPAAPPPSYYSSYSVSSSLMHPQVNRWIPGSGSTHASPLELTTRSSASTTTSIENGALFGQTASSPIDVKGRKDPVSSDKQWQANHVIKDIQRILDEKINELQRVYQGSIEQYCQLVRHQEERILELERQLKNLQAERTLRDILPLNVGAFVYPAWARNSPVRLWRTQ